MINIRPTQLRINLDALVNNYNKLNSLSQKKAGLAIVKANAYGMGAKVIAKALYDNGVRHFATATLEEALEIKEVVKTSLILVLGVVGREGVVLAAKNNISLACPSKLWLQEALEELENSNEVLKVHLKFDTGMYRIGIFDEQEVKEIVPLLESKNLDFEGVFSHYSNADGDNDDYDNYQTANFEKLLHLLPHKPKYVHIENSAGSIKYNTRQDNYNLSRFGISLYGAFPSENIEHLHKLELETVATLVSKVVHIKKVPRGAKIGYGITYEAHEDEYIATIPVGYADGVLRRSQGFKLKINGEDCEIVGRVCMDQLMVRCSGDVKVGDDVLIFGELDGEKISVDDFATYQNTISYEIFCCINERVPRVYYKNNMEL